MSLVNSFVPPNVYIQSGLRISPSPVSDPGASLDLYGNLSGEELAFVVNLNNSTLFRVFANGTLGVTYAADATAGGSGAGDLVEATGDFTPPTSSTATCVIAGVSFTSTFDTNANTTVDNLITAIQADDVVSALVDVSRVSSKLHVVAKAGCGELGNQITTTSDEAHGASFAATTLTGGVGSNSQLDAATGRMIWAANQVTYSVLNANVDDESIVTPVVETPGLNLALGVVPLEGGFLLFNPVAGPQMQVSFSVLS